MDMEESVITRSHNLLVDFFFMYIILSPFLWVIENVFSGGLQVVYSMYYYLKLKSSPAGTLYLFYHSRLLDSFFSGIHTSAALFMIKPDYLKL
jgi:hypothetical protein